MDAGVGLLILFGEDAEAFRGRKTRVTLLINRENGTLKFEDTAGLMCDEKYRNGR